MSDFPNPYESSKASHRTDSLSVVACRSSASRMWVAYLVAPGVAPLAFVAQLFAFGLVCVMFGSYVNPISFVFLPGMALTAGMLASYTVAGLIGMPIAFVLRWLGLLNFYSIHISAFVWCCVFAAISRYFIAGDGIPEGYGARWFFYVLAMTGPPILLSATMFWLITLKLTPTTDTANV